MCDGGTELFIPSSPVRYCGDFLTWMLCRCSDSGGLAGVVAQSLVFSYNSLDILP